MWERAREREQKKGKKKNKKDFGAAQNTKLYMSV